MRQYFIEDELRHKFKTHSTVSGVLLLLAGIFAILLPDITSLTISLLMGWLLIVGSIISAYHVTKSYNTKLMAWLKPFLLFIIGALILYKPMTGVAAVGILLMIYFFFDGFAGIMFGLEFRPVKGWIWMIFNGLISFVIAFIFLIGWPISLLWLIGLLVGISLIMDGTAMILIGSSVQKHLF